MLVENKMHDVMCTDERKQKGVSDSALASGIGVVVMEVRVLVPVMEVVVLVTEIVVLVTEIVVLVMEVAVLVMEVAVLVMEVAVLVDVVVEIVVGGAQQVAMFSPSTVLPLFCVFISSLAQFISFVGKVLPVHLPLTQASSVHPHVHVQAISSESKMVFLKMSLIITGLAVR
jgi:hypothetical protein